MNNALISIKPPYVEQILSGIKTVELRRQPMNLTAGARLWIYSTLPKGCIEAVATIASIEVGSPSLLWRKHGRSMGITYAHFCAYLLGSKTALAITLNDIKRLRHPLTLAQLRTEHKVFHPPQSFIHLENKPSLLNTLNRSRI